MSKKASVGEVRSRKDGDYKKIGNSQWERISKTPSKAKPSNMQGAKFIETEVLEYFQEGLPAKEPQSLKIIDAINSYVDGKVIRASRPGGRKEPKADLIVETETKKYRISVKSGNAYTATFGTASFFNERIKAVTDDPEVLRRAEEVSTYVGYIQNYSRTEKGSEQFIDKYVDKYMDKNAPNVSKEEVKKELKSKFKENVGDYKSILREREKSTIDFFKWLEVEKKEVHAKLYYEAFTGSDEFGKDSDATAEYIVNTTGMHKLDMDYARNKYTGYYRLQGVPRRGIRKAGLQKAENKVEYICNELTKTQLSIKI